MQLEKHDPITEWPRARRQRKTNSKVYQDFLIKKRPQIRYSWTKAILAKVGLLWCLMSCWWRRQEMVVRLITLETCRYHTYHGILTGNNTPTWVCFRTVGAVRLVSVVVVRWLFLRRSGKPVHHNTIFNLSIDHCSPLLNTFVKYYQKGSCEL